MESDDELMGVSRRKVLKQAALASAGAFITPAASGAQDRDIRIAGRPCEIVVTPATAKTVRISVLPLQNGQPESIPDDGSLVPRTWPAPAARSDAGGQVDGRRAGASSREGGPGIPG